MLSILKTRLRLFGDDTRGYITIEALIVMPALLWLFAACWVYFDVFRQQGVNQKANYTIGDMVSRETDPIDDTYINNAMNLLYMLNKSQGTESDLRITVVRYNSKNDQYQVVWSEARGDYPVLANNVMKHYKDRLPIMAHNAQVIVVETWDDYKPVFAVGLDPFEIKTYSFTHPRYAPQVLFVNSEDNNGWGNGDQDAPGDSLCNNSAENETNCTNATGENNIEPSNGNNGNGGSADAGGSTDPAPDAEGSSI